MSVQVEHSFRKLAYIGAGRLSEQIASFVEAALPQGSFRSVYFGQPSETATGKEVFPFEAFADSEFAAYEFYIGLGYRQLLRKLEIVEQLQKLGRHLPPAVHPSSYVHPSCRVGSGAIIYPGCVLGPRCEIGRGALLNVAVTLAHDVKVGDVCYLAPSVTVSGFCQIGEASFLGTGTLLSNDLTLGRRCRLGIGSVVTRSLPNDSQGLGNPFQFKSFELI